MSANQAARPALCFMLAMLLGACAARPPAPVVERSTIPRAEIPVDGLHRVSRGDTLHGIAFKYGLDWRDIARWNRIAAPYTIYPDQVVRLRAPPRIAEAPAARTAPARPEVRTVPTPSARSRPADPAPAKASAAPAAPAPAAGGWAWPAEGRVLRTFKSGDPARNGLDIAGSEGQPVRAAAGGEVVYSGNGLIGYGELIIVKHDDRMLSAYAHNRRRLVSEGERVERGARIAEMGRNGRDEVLLHFEIRRDGKPVDPLSYLPKR
jgi:lipoprotein NlpD